jgi:hypothetical protein
MALTNRFRKWSIVLLFIFIIMGCSRFLLKNHFKSQIKMGMSVTDVMQTLSKYRSLAQIAGYSFSIKKIESEGGAKDGYGQCLTTNPSFECEMKFKRYREGRETKEYDVKEFIQTVDAIAQGEAAGAIYEPQISVHLIGLGFDHFNFQIYFNPQGRVKSVLDVKVIDWQ